MSEVRVRKAMLQDVDSFQALWQKFAEQQHEEGSPQLPNAYNLKLYTDMFRSYVSGVVPGLVLLVTDGSKDVGLHMEGEMAGGFELSIGRYTMLWGDYLEPAYRGQGISHQIYQAAMEWTYQQGYTGGITGILVGDKSVPQILEKVVDGTHGATPTKPYTIEVCWEFEGPAES